MTRRKKENRGGYREGAGRPVEIKDRVQVVIHLERTHVNQLDRLARQWSTSRSGAFRMLLDSQ